MFEIPFSELPQSLKIDMQHDPALLRPHFLEIPLSGSHEQGDVSSQGRVKHEKGRETRVRQQTFENLRTLSFATVTKLRLVHGADYGCLTLP
jgi:hypothetical protein